MRLNFTKMHGAGNDFVVIDLVTQRCNLRRRHIRRIADRHFGVGCDQVLVVEPPRRPDVDFRYRIFNADGSEAEQCGNGARCFARFVLERRLTGKQHIRVESRAGLLELRMLDHERVEVGLGEPRFEPADIPFEAPARAPCYTLAMPGETLEVGAVSMGNPHAVLRVPDCDTAEVSRLGPAVQALSVFPKGVNVGFMQIISPHEIRLRVYERGAGETLACGSGACAAVVYGISRGWLQEGVQVHLPGGDLEIRWRGEGEPVIMQGPTAVVFEGSIRI